MKKPNMLLCAPFNQFIICLFAAATLFSSKLYAQCSTNNLKIGTGYNYTTNTSIAVGGVDPEWVVTYLSPHLRNHSTTPATLPYLPTTYNAIVTEQYANNPWYTDPNNKTKWISYNDTNTIDTWADSTYEMRIERKFTICEGDSISIYLKGGRDNWVNLTLVYPNTTSTVLFADVPSFPSFPATAPAANFNSGNVFYNQTLYLVPGTYTIVANVFNQNVALANNAIGFMLDGDSYIASASSKQSIRQDSCDECQPIVYDCDDECYWKLDGNNIIHTFAGIRNNFGSTNDYDIDIISNNNDRGVIKNGDAVTGGYLGWNTMNPTARLHVDCINGNENGSGTSDIRFENLEQNEGWILVIDDQGYVYRTNVHVNEVRGADAGGANLRPSDDYVQMLEARIKALEEKINALSGTSSTGIITPESDMSKLFQNTPNPFGTTAVIEYYIHRMEASAQIVIYDLAGRELLKSNIEKTGKGKMTVSSEKLVPGTYVYSLVVDGAEIDSKRMVVVK